MMMWELTYKDVRQEYGSFTYVWRRFVEKYGRLDMETVKDFEIRKMRTAND